MVEINFVMDPKYKSIIDNGVSADTIIKSISLVDSGKEMVLGNTLIFFDEIQACPEIATSLKFVKRTGSTM